MKNLAVLLLLLSSLLMISCSEEELVQRREDKIFGTWTYQRAFFKGRNALFRDDITHLYKDDIITFHTDYTCTYDDAGRRSVYEGDWFVTLEVFTDPDGTENVYFLDAFFYGAQPEDDFGYYAEIEWLTQNNMTISYQTDDGEYTYKLDRY